MNVVIDRPTDGAQTTRRIHPVVLSGGAGTRLWPLSRQAYPKQLLPLVGERTMLQATVARTAAAPGFAPPLVICNDEHRFLVAEQLQETGVEPQRIVLEPASRNTAPALAAAAIILTQTDPDAVMLVQPSDHHMADVDGFRRAVEKGLEAVAQGKLTTFGIRPSRPETGYGYIQNGSSIDGADGVFAVERFVEKPDRETAKRFVDSGTYYWNSGIFLLSARHYLEELRRLAGPLLQACEAAVEAGRDDLDFFRLDVAAFEAAPDISIDHAVMEHTREAAVVPVDIGWTDIGSWQALREAQRPGPDSAGNVFHGDVVAEGARNCYIRSEDRLVAAIGTKNLIIVTTDDAVLVAASDCCGEVGRLVTRLKQGNRQEPLHHTKVYRPWGYYQTVDAGDRFQVKRIMVKPGAQLSLQMHHHRAEHWVVVSGTARVTCDDKSWLLCENESTYIPLGSNHRLENPGRIPLHLIEVQSGAYLGEDDIVRFDDTYGRC